MSIRNKADVLKSIRRIERNRPDGVLSVTFEVSFGRNQLGKKMRKCFGSLAEAKKAVEEFFRLQRQQGEVALNVLRPAQVYDAAEAIQVLSEAGVRLSLREVANAYLDALQSKRKPITARTLGEAYDEYLAAMSNKSTAHTNAIGTRVGAWVEATGRDRQLASIRQEDVVPYLELKKKASLKTYNNVLSYLKMFFKWCADGGRCYLQESPLDHVSVEAIPYREPEYLRVNDVRAIVSAMETHPHASFLLSYAALNFFCGIRNDEIGRLAEFPADILLQDNTVRISRVKGWTLGRMPRAFSIPDNAGEFLKLHYKPDTLSHYKRPQVMFRRMLNEIGQKLGIRIPENAGRHSFITYHVAAFGDPGKTEGIAGTSRKMRCSHYMGLTSKADGEAYFNIRPTVVPNANAERRPA